MYQNPQKTFTVSFPMEEVKAAILKLQNKSCELIKNDAVLNEVILHDKEKLGFGHHVSFTLNALSDSQTSVLLEVKKSHSAISSSTDATIAGNKLTRYANDFSNQLSGNTNVKKGGGCLGVAGALAIILIGFVGLSIKLL